MLGNLDGASTASGPVSQFGENLCCTQSPRQTLASWLRSSGFTLSPPAVSAVLPHCPPEHAGRCHRVEFMGWKEAQELLSYRVDSSRWWGEGG